MAVRKGFGAPCSVEGCERPYKTRGMCGMHAERVRNGITVEGPKRTRQGVPFAELYSRADSGCWEWAGYVDQSTGYGRYSKEWAHRASYQIHVGPIPAGLVIDHLCRNRRCVNPLHLEAVTSRENSLRGEHPSFVAHRENKCQRGHEFTPENTYHRPDGAGRQCRTCNALRARRAA